MINYILIDCSPPWSSFSWRNEVIELTDNNNNKMPNNILKMKKSISINYALNFSCSFFRWEFLCVALNRDNFTPMAAFIIIIQFFLQFMLNMNISKISLQRCMLTLQWNYIKFVPNPATHFLQWPWITEIPKILFECKADLMLTRLRKVAKKLAQK